MPQAIAKEDTCVAGSGVATGSHRIAVAWLSALPTVVKTVFSNFIKDTSDDVDPDNRLSAAPPFRPITRCLVQKGDAVSDRHTRGGLKSHEVPTGCSKVWMRET